MRWNNKLFHQPQATADIILKCYTQAIIVIVKKCVGVGEEQPVLWSSCSPTDTYGFVPSSNATGINKRWDFLLMSNTT